VKSNIIDGISKGPLQIIIECSFAIHLFFAFLIILSPFLLEFEEMFKIPNSKSIIYNDKSIIEIIVYFSIRIWFKTCNSKDIDNDFPNIHW